MLPAGRGVRVRGDHGFGGPRDRTLPPTTERVPARWLVGRWTRAGLAPTAERAFVRGVQRHALRPRRNELVLERGDGTTTIAPVVGRCLLERPPGALPTWTPPPSSTTDVR